MHKQFMELQVMQGLQGAQIAELQGKLDKLESQQGPTRGECEGCLLSPAVGMNHRKTFVTWKICLHSSTGLQLHGVIILH